MVVLVYIFVKIKLEDFIKYVFKKNYIWINNFNVVKIFFLSFYYLLKKKIFLSVINVNLNWFYYFRNVDILVFRYEVEFFGIIFLGKFFLIIYNF